MKILIVGHGEYGSGMKSAIKLLTGVNNNIEAINLNEELTHNASCDTKSFLDIIDVISFILFTAASIISFSSSWEFNISWFYRWAYKPRD